MPNVSGGGWLRTIDNGVVIPAFVSPESAQVRTYERRSELAASCKSGLWQRHQLALVRCRLRSETLV